ncbi:MAG: B12-binding domain-containing radical SAM protein, partial [Candidatus Latescibacterota bacterium]
MTNNIALIHPYFKTDSHRQFLFRPLGIASLASQMKSLGLPVFITDCTFKTREESIQEIVARDPAIVGVYIAINLHHDALNLVHELRERLPGTLFIAGGPLPTVFPDRFAKNFEVVFRGEGDLVVPRFCRDYLALRKREKFHHVLEFYTYPGIYTHFRSQLIQYAPIHYPAPILNTLPIPYRKDLDHARYQRYWMEKSGFRPITVMATRGCPFECESGSNPVFGKIYRKRGLDRVLREIDVAERDGYNQMWFVDDCFSFDKEYTRAFCEMMSGRPGAMEWACTVRASGMDHELSKTMRQAGCAKMTLPLESGSDELLRRMGRTETVGDRLRTVEMLNRIGIKVDASFIVGYPGESRESVEKTLSLALSLPLADIFFNVPFHLSGANSHESGYLLGGREAGSEGFSRFFYSREIDGDWLNARI